MKKIYFCYLLFLNIFISATPIEEINIFFTNDLTFVQTSLNKIDNSFDKSEGSYKKSPDKIRIDIEEVLELAMLTMKILTAGLLKKVMR